jgi:hypothetical protein
VGEIKLEPWRRAPSPGGTWAKLVHDPSRASLFLDAGSDDPVARDMLQEAGAVAAILVPIAAPDLLLGVLAVSVTGRPTGCARTPTCSIDSPASPRRPPRRCGTGTCLTRSPTGRCTTRLTALANRTQFTERCREAVEAARDRDQRVTLFYIDLDRFRPVNDDLGHGSATSCWSSSGSGSPVAPGAGTSWPGWAATSSRS